MIELTSNEELKEVSGGWFWVALPLFVGGGYKYGSDRAKRDNEREKEASEPPQQCPVP